MAPPRCHRLAFLRRSVARDLPTLPPVSRVSPLPAAETSPNFLVHWCGTDTGYGIEFYTIYVSDNGGPVPWLTQTAATQPWYPGFLGHTYGFYGKGC